MIFRLLVSFKEPENHPAIGITVNTEQRPRLSTLPRASNRRSRSHPHQFAPNAPALLTGAGGIFTTVRSRFALGSKGREGAALPQTPHG